MGQTMIFPEIEHMEKHPELVKQATRYVVVRDNWLSAGREHKTEKDRLVELMKQAGLHRYTDAEDDLLIELENGKESIRVKKLSEAEDA